MAEKARGVTVSIFGIVLGIIEFLLALFIIYFAININIMIAQIITPLGYMASPAYLIGITSATGAIILLGGAYVLVHAIKRIIDHAFKGYISFRQ